MRTLLSVLVAAAAVAVAQPGSGISRGDALRRREYQTYGTVALFVDPSGSDANACTSSGAAACLTLTGAVSKIPAQLRNNVTITVANGTYSDSAVLQGFRAIGGSVGLTLTVQGDFIGATLSSGSNTGTVTAITDQPDDGSALGSVTDGAQTWTVNELRGSFVEFTSGAQVGSWRPIISNTATTLAYAGSYATDPLVGDTYRISRPGAVWNAGGVTEVSNVHGLTVSLTKLQQAGAMILSEVGNVIQVQGIRIVTASTAMTVDNARVAFQAPGPSYIQSTTGPAINLPSVPVSTMGAWVNAGGLYVRVLGVGGSGAVFGGVGSRFNIINNGTVYLQASAGSSNAVFTLRGADITAVNSTRTSLFVDCLSGASSIGVDGNRSATQDTSAPSNAFFHNTNVINCTTAFAPNNGARFNWQAGSGYTVSGVTNEITVDSMTTYTFATLTSFSPALVTTPRLTVVSSGLP